MNHQEISLVLNFIRPKAEWSLTDTEITWLDKVQVEPTKTEIEAGWVAYQAKLEADKVEAVAKREAAEAKLAALGLTAEDLQALGLGGT